jgi:outer membrane protein OmpA-like peptidoglycan-associated protein
MKNIRIILLLLIFQSSFGQNDSSLIKPGERAPAFILGLPENGIQSFTMPHMHRVVLLHFWSSNVPKSKAQNKFLNRLTDRYKDAMYTNADGFEVIAIAVQTDKNGWLETIKNDSLTNLTHGIAIRGYQDEVCKKYGVTTLPSDVLIDENGIVLAINPRLVDIESTLDDRKNMQPMKKDIVGTLALSSNKNEPVKFCRVFLFNYYGDSIQITITSSKGGFIFNNVKVNQDFVIKIDNKADINTTDPIALFTPDGEFMMDGRTKNKGFVFYVPARSSYKLVQSDTNSNINYLGQIDVIKHLTFFTNGMGLTPKDEQDLNSILKILQKDKLMKVELATHTDARMDAVYAKELTTYQASSIKSYFEKKGIAADRIKVYPKGNTELRKICEGTVDCREEDHNLNRRVEFLIYKD